MMTNQEIEMKILDIYTNQMKDFHSDEPGGSLKETPVPLDQLSLEAVGINSVGFISLIVAIEKEFGFQFEDDMLNIELFQVIGDLISYIETQINQADMSSQVD